MTTPDNNESSHHVQNDPHRCKIKLGKFNFDILWCYGVIRDFWMYKQQRQRQPTRSLGRGSKFPPNLH